MIPDLFTLNVVESSLPPAVTLAEHRRERSSWTGPKRPTLRDMLAGWWRR